MVLQMTRVKRQLSPVTLDYEEGKNKHHSHTSEHVFVQHLLHKWGPDPATVHISAGRSAHVSAGRWRSLPSPPSCPHPSKLPCVTAHPSASAHPHCHRLQMPGLLLPCHHPLTPHRPVSPPATTCLLLPWKSII